MGDNKVNLFIGGKWCDASDRETRELINPASGEIIGSVPVATSADIDRSLSAAARGFVVWREFSPFDRHKILKRAADLVRERAASIAAWLTEEQGKPLAESLAELGNCADIFEWYAEEGRRSYGRSIPARIAGVSQTVQMEPIGAVAAFSPWNFPASQAAKKLGAALGAGCSVVLKGPEEAPTASMELVRALDDAGVPKGVVNLLFGDPAAISDRLIRSPVIRKISFTGSVPVGKHLASLAASHMKPSTMELGGHAPAIVFEDVEIDKVAAQLAGFKYRNAGQVCIAPSRFYVHQDVYERFVERFVASAAAIRVGPGSAADTQMGPLANRRRLEAMEQLVSDAISRGANLRTGGNRIGNSGYFFEPTVLSEVPEEARIMQEEPFGPVAPIAPFDDFDDVIGRANATDYGLAAYCFTRSGERAMIVSRAFESGMVSINHFGIGPTETPFGGVKDSGFGREGGYEGLFGYMTTKFVSHKYA